MGNKGIVRGTASKIESEYMKMSPQEDVFIVKVFHENGNRVEINIFVDKITGVTEVGQIHHN